MPPRFVVVADPLETARVAAHHFSAWHADSWIRAVSAARDHFDRCGEAVASLADGVGVPIPSPIVCLMLAIAALLFAIRLCIVCVGAITIHRRFRKVKFLKGE